MRNNNEKAFALHIPTQEGMDLRDYFAAKALGQITTIWPDQAVNHLGIAQQAYKLADAMMEARK